MDKKSINMEKLKDLQDIRNEILEMEFSYKNVLRLMYLIYESKILFECTSILPNKEIALHQINKIIEHELMDVIRSEGEVSIRQSFNNLLDNFKLVLTYITLK